MQVMRFTMNLYVMFITFEQIHLEQIFPRDSRIILLPKIMDDLFAFEQLVLIFRRFSRTIILIEFLPEQHLTQHQVQIHQDKLLDHQKLMAEGTTPGHIHCRVLPGLFLALYRAS